MLPVARRVKLFILLFTFILTISSVSYRTRAGEALFSVTLSPNSSRFCSVSRALSNMPPQRSTRTQWNIHYTCGHDKNSEFVKCAKNEKEGGQCGSVNRQEQKHLVMRALAVLSNR